MSGNPRTMTICRPGNVTRSPDGLASAPFWVEMLLEGEARGENTAMRATLDPGTVTQLELSPTFRLFVCTSRCPITIGHVISS